MSIISLYKNSTHIRQHLHYSLLIKFQQLPNIWLLNCYEGCQHILTQKHIKISQISKIIITELNTKNISGLLGLLSSLSLSTRINKLDIYGPVGLYKYISLGRRYSQTNFRYTLQIHHIKTGLILSDAFSKIYAFANNNINTRFNYTIINIEKASTFNLQKAIESRVPSGPLYGKLKIGYDFILPDGSFIYGNRYIKQYISGNKVSLIHNCGIRLNYMISRQSKVTLL